MAAEGAVRVVELLNDFDEITVIPVDTQPDNQIGPLPASDKETAIGLIRQIGAGGGGIYVRTGLEAAAAALAQSPNQVKHIILLADGADSEQKEGTPELIDALTAEGVTVSTVSIGQGPDTLWLQQMAKRGNGRFHFTDRAANLPQIFTQETTAIQRSYLVEERFFPDLVSNSPILAGITAVPPLYGYVGTSPKSTAQVILSTHLDDPLLAAWQYGLGRAVAWTSRRHRALGQRVGAVAWLPGVLGAGRPVDDGG
ncbi:MAG: VWA domain-containing protein [Chloroflexi bacterium]|nr:VWA domain-containing protein [Chloroflexota bacterium]